MVLRLPGGFVISRAGAPLAEPDAVPQPAAAETDPPETETPDTPGTPAPRPRKAMREKRHVLLRLFGIGLWGGFKLIVLCVLVGFFVMAANFNPSSPDVDVGETLFSLAGQAFAATGWAVRNFWKPALAGASVVLPLWILWRLVSLPFRR